MSKTVETYYYGNGRVFLRPVGSIGNGGWRWAGDVSTLTFGGTDETASHKESYSGQKSKVRSFSIGGDRTIKGTWHQVDPVTIAELLRGTIAREIELTGHLSAFVDRNFADLSPIEACILLAGAYELVNCPQTPYRVIINEAIELTKGFGGTDGHKYVNGVLDKLAARLRPVEVEAKRASRKGG